MVGDRRRAKAGGPRHGDAAARRPLGSDRMRGPLGSGAELGPTLGELGLEALDDGRVHLGDARLAQVERGADLLHGQLLVVVQDDDQALVAVEALGHHPHEVLALEPARGVLALLVLEDVDLADVAAVVSYLRRELSRLDKLPDSHISTGDIKFVDPAAEQRVIAEIKSSNMEKGFTSEDLARLKKAVSKKE